MIEYEKVLVWIHHGDHTENRHVLLLRTNEIRGSFWQPVTGTVEEGEGVAAAALREATEETGLPFATAPVALGIKYRFATAWGHATEHAFEVKAQGRDVRIDPLEHQAFRWVPVSEALTLLKWSSNQDALRGLMEKWEE